LYNTFLIASPSVIVREGLKTLLRSDSGMYWVGDTLGENELLARVRDLRVDILLFDLDLLDETAGDTLARVRSLAPDTKIVALADAWSDQRIVPALRSGAHGFIIRRSTAGEISEAMRAAQSGSLVLNPAAAELLKRQLQPPETPLEHLSTRELDVLRALARGLPNKLIAQELVISEHTVKFHIRSILDKLNAANRTEAVRNAFERGLISI
jgi:two-component system, NarL family, response regulator LiaR